MGLAWAGTRLLYSTSLAGGAGVSWSTDIGSGESHLVVPTAAWARLSTTADGRTVFYARPTNEIWRSGTDGSHPAQVPQVSGSEPAVAPDGSSLFFISLSSGRQLLYVIDLPDGAPRQLGERIPLHGSLSVSQMADSSRSCRRPAASGSKSSCPSRRRAGSRFPLAGSTPGWTPDRQGLAYVDRTGLAIWIQPIAGGAPHRLVAFADRPILSFAWSPNGRQLAISRAMTVSDIVLLRGVR